MKVVIAAGVLLSLSMLNAAATTQDDEFRKIAGDYIERYLQANPEEATELGDHRFDGQLTDYSPDARAKDLATQKEFRDKLNAIDGSKLTGANSIDFRILKENIDYQIFQAEELKQAEWNPLVYMQSLCQQPLSVGRTRFRASRKTDSKSAPAHGENSGRDCSGESQPPASAARPHGDSD